LSYSACIARLDHIWAVLDGHVDRHRIPGYVAAVRAGGSTELRASGHKDLGGSPMRTDTLFRIASITKPIGGALLLSLVEDGLLQLDDPIATWLPEASAPRVLKHAAAELDDTVPAERPITVRQLATMTCGWGVVFADTPLRREMFARDVFSGALGHEMSGDEFVSRIAGIPLAFQPGEGWLYDTGINVLGVLLTRATGRSLTQLFQDRIFGPLQMTDTAFHGAADRLATAYKPAQDGLAVLDPPDGRFSRAPAFEELSGGLVSTAGDLLKFFAALADGDLLTANSRELMVADALTPKQRQEGVPILDPGGSWGLCTGLYPGGAWGWQGGTGTTARVDPASDSVAVLLTQRMMADPQDAYPDFHAAVQSRPSSM
jgi:CubicO group peptidase (beta-lactamase class C family)